MGYLGATLTQVFTRARSGHVTQRCHNSPRWETGLASANDVTHRKSVEDFGNLKKVRRVETRHRTRRVDFRLLAEALGKYRTRSGTGEKARIERLCLSPPYVEKPLNSKVIKSFVPELRSRKCFSCFEIPMFYVIYIWTLYVHFAYRYHGYGTPVLFFHKVLALNNVRRLICYLKKKKRTLVWFGLVCWVLWHINLFLFNAKSIFM